MQNGGGLGGQHFLGFVQLGTRQFFQPRDLVFRQICEQTQEAADIAIFGVAPELP